MLRLFVGLAPPDPVRAALAGLRAGIPGARWVAPESLHLTLVFVGEVDEGAAEDLDAALAAVRAPAFDLRLAGIGHFGDRGRARSVWVGVERHPALEHLQARVEAAAAHAGTEPERRRFKPHIALARLRDAPSSRVGAFIALNNGFAAGPFRVDRFTLFRSRLGGERAIYEALAEYPLDDDAPPPPDPFRG